MNKLVEPPECNAGRHPQRDDGPRECQPDARVGDRRDQGLDLIASRISMSSFSSAVGAGGAAGAAAS